MDYDELAEHVARFKNNDESAFVRIYELTSNLVYNIACSALRDMDEAQDVVQEVFIKVYTRIDTLRDNYSFIRWLHVITSNTCQDHIKSRSAFQISAEADSAGDDPDQFNIWFENQCRQEILSDMIRALPPEQMRTVYRYYYDQLSLGDIAALDNCSINTVKSRLYYARNTLRLAIEAEEKRLGEKLHLPAAVTAMSAMMLLPQFSVVLSQTDAARILTAVFAAVGAGYARDSFDIITDVMTEEDPNTPKQNRMAEFFTKSWFVRLKTSFFVAAAAAVLFVCGLTAVTAYTFGAERADGITAVPERPAAIPSEKEKADPLLESLDEPVSANIKATQQPAVTEEMDIRYQLIDGGAAITAVTTTASDIEIPAKIDGFPVTTIMEGAFTHNVTAVSVTVPGSVTLIDDKAFAFCTQLKEVIVRDGDLKKIGIDAFRGCVSLKSVILPDGLQIIGKNAFRRTGLETLHIPESVVNIGNQCFTECAELTEIRIPNGVDKIEDTTFMNCVKLAKVVLPEHLREIGIDAFRGCVSLESIELPGTIHVIYASAFYGSGLRKVVLSDTIGMIHNFAFAGCEQLASVIVTSKRNHIFKDNVFADCTSLSHIEFYGDVPSEWGENVISGSDRLVLYYHEGTEGWTEGAWTAPDGRVYKTECIE